MQWRSNRSFAAKEPNHNMPGDNSESTTIRCIRSTRYRHPVATVRDPRLGYDRGYDPDKVSTLLIWSWL
jgi:hypothetical protein